MCEVVVEGGAILLYTTDRREAGETPAVPGGRVGVLGGLLSGAVETPAVLEAYAGVLGGFTISRTDCVMASWLNTLSSHPSWKICFLACAMAW